MDAPGRQGSDYESMESESRCFKEYVLSDVRALSSGQVGHYYGLWMYLEMSHTGIERH